MRRFEIVWLDRTRRSASAWVAGLACLGVVSLVAGCARPSLMSPAQAAAIQERDRALASQATAIQAAIGASGTAGALAFLDGGDARLVTWPGDDPADAWARHAAAPDSDAGRVSVPAVVTFVYRSDVPKAPETVTRAALEREYAARTSAISRRAEQLDAVRQLEARLADVQRELTESMASSRQDTDASLATARAETQKSLTGVSDDLEGLRKFVLQTAQLGWLNQEVNAENAGGIRQLATASQELSATAARLQETMRQMSEQIGGQLKELAQRLEALQGKVTSLK